jgi:hypothetical protein
MKMDDTKQTNTDSQEYVEVADEPLHKQLYANAYFRAYVASLAPGQATLYHRHSENTLYLVLNGGRMRTVTFKGAPRSPMVFSRSFPFYRKIWLALQNIFGGSAYLPDGLSFFMPSKAQPSIHLAAASRRNRHDVCLMGIEIHCGAVRHLPLVHEVGPGHLEYDNGLFKAMVCTLAFATSSRIAVPGYHLFVVCLSGCSEVTLDPTAAEPGIRRHLDKGDYLSLSGDSPLSANNPGREVSDLFILAVPMDLP